MPKAGIEVEGQRELRASLKRAGHGLNDLKDAHRQAADMVAGAARPETPVGETGRLAASVRAAGTANASIIRAGSASVPYGGPIHYGWPARNIKAQPWISEAAQSTEPRWTHTFFEAVQRLLDRVKGV